MDTMSLAVAGVAALAILLIAVGVATSGGSGISDRLERYAAKPQPGAKAGASGQGGVAELLAQSQALASLNKVVEGRDFGANLARDIARADLHLKPSEFLGIWGASIVGVPLVMFLLSPFLPALGQSDLPADRAAHRVHAAALLAGSPPQRPAGGLQQAPAGHDHADRQRPARRLVLPAGDRTGRP